MDKRSFIKNAGLAGLGSIVGMDGLKQLIDYVSVIPPSVLATDEDFWAEIRGGHARLPMSGLKVLNRPTLLISY
jgi:hypothetical protein